MAGEEQRTLTVRVQRKDPERPRKKIPLEGVRVEAGEVPPDREVVPEPKDGPSDPPSETQLGSLDPEAPPLPPAATSVIRRVGSATLAVAAGRAELTWAGIEEDLSHLEAGADLVAAFATAPGLGAFR